MYNSTTKTYTLEDKSGSLGWIVESCDPADYASMTDADVLNWIDGLIDASKDDDRFSLDEQLETMTFPRFGYTTADVFADSDSYRAFRLQQMETDYQTERPFVLEYLKDWISSSADDSE